MKGMFKRALAGVAAAALAVTGFALAAGSANAAGVTVSGVQAGHTYTAYRIATYSGARLNEAGDKVDYVDVTTDPTNAGAVSTAITTAGQTVSEPYVGNPAAWLATQPDSVVRQFAEKFQAGILDATITATATGDPNSTGDFSTLPEGWYVITDTKDGAKAGTPMVVSTKITVNDNAYDFADMTLGTVVSKPDDAPKPGKTAEEKSTALGVGDEVHYTITAQVPNFDGMDLGTVAFAVKDMPGTGLTVKADSVNAYVEVPADTEGATTITVDGQPKTVMEIAATSSLNQDLTGGPDASFTVDMTAWAKTSYAAHKGANVYVQYTATINSDVQESTTVSNTPALSTKPGVYTNGDPMTVTVGGFQFHKYGVDGDKNGLAGAKFKVFAGADADVEEGTPLNFTNTANGYVYSADGAAGSVTELVSTKGTVMVNGLKAGTYTVYESEVPTAAGYADNYHAKFTVTVNTDGSWSLGDTNDHKLASQTGTEAIQVLNVKSFTQLPVTGAAGTALFTVLGLLIAGAGALVYMKSRSVKHALRG